MTNNKIDFKIYRYLPIFNIYYIKYMYNYLYIFNYLLILGEGKKHPKQTINKLA